MMNLPVLFFIYHAVLIIALSLIVITRKSPVHSVLFMLVLFFHIASLYLFLNAEFLAAIQIIIYAGAIMVLFLFVIFLLDLKQEVVANRYIYQWPTSIVIAGGVFAVIAYSVSSLVLGPTGKYSSEYIDKVGNTKAIGQLMYTQYIFPFEIASMVLLVGLIGAVVLAKKHIKK